MRISLRTLLALEDGVFDADHRRHLEQQISADNESAAVLGRIRAAVHNPSIGVPGLVEQQEEIDPNYVAEYLDHQMPDDVQNRFETFCLSADKYIAEIASVHQILSSVLGEPARSSRECRLRCYEVLRKPPAPLVLERPKTPEPLPERFVAEEGTAEPKTLPKTFRFWRLFPLLKAKLTERPLPSGTASFYSFKSLLAGAILCYFLFHLSGKIDFRIPRAEHATEKIAEHTAECTVERTAERTTDHAAEHEHAEHVVQHEHEPANLKRTPEPAAVIPKIDTAAAVPAPNTGQKPSALAASDPIQQTNFTEETAAADSPASHNTAPHNTAPHNSASHNSTRYTDKKNPAENTADHGKKKDQSGNQSDPIDPIRKSEQSGRNQQISQSQNQPQSQQNEKPALPPENDPFMAAAVTTDAAADCAAADCTAAECAAAASPVSTEDVPENKDQTMTAAVPPKPETVVKPLPEKKYPIMRTADDIAAMQSEREEAQITFQPILASEKKRGEEPAAEKGSVPHRGLGQPASRLPATQPATSWLSVKNVAETENFRLEDTKRDIRPNALPVVAAAEPVPPVPHPHHFPPEETLTMSPIISSAMLPEMLPAMLPAMLPKKASQPVTLMSAAVPRVLGHIIPTTESNLLFSASGIDEQWSLAPVPSNLTGGQYLLSANPFRGAFELTAGFRIEMIGDVKLSILPMNAAGVQGIFVDYGRIVIHPLKPDASMRIEMENVRGVMTISGASGTVFIDTFAEVHEPHIQPPEGGKPKISPILGLVPKNGETLSWQAAGQPQPFTTNKQGSLVLSANPYRFGEIKNLPNWIGNLPETPEDRRLAETCRRYFADHQGSSSKALPLMLQDESETIRALAFRLLGDLGEFSFAVQAMAEKRTNNKAIRSMLVPYFNEVMKRDAETVQRFADAITAAKQSSSSP